MAEEKPLRVLIHVTDRSQYWIQACRWSETSDSQNSLVILALQLIKDEKLYITQQEPPAIRLLAIQKYRTRLFFAFDISNHDYDAKLGHFPDQKQNDLPVVIVHLSTRAAVYRASQGQRKNINEDVARLHDCNGDGSIPPFIEDHTEKPPEYPNPRSLRRC